MPSSAIFILYIAIAGQIALEDRLSLNQYITTLYKFVFHTVLKAVQRANNANKYAISKGPRSIANHKAPSNPRLPLAPFPCPTLPYINLGPPSALLVFFLPFFSSYLPCLGGCAHEGGFTTDWALHCTARRNSPFNGLRVIDRRILWHRSLWEHILISFHHFLALRGGTEKRIYLSRSVN